MRITLDVEPTVTAPALHLRPWIDGDVEALVAAYKDPEMRRWLPTWFDDEAGARRWLAVQEEGWNTGARLSFAIVEEGRVVGHFVIKRGGIDPAVPAAEPGYWTLAEARGRGIASRSLESVSQWLSGPQDVMPVQRLELIHSVGNDASCRVAEKCGYLLDSILPPHPPFPDDGHLHIRAV
jgi:RimJ/RimL family protein N-acetyltransferase